MFKIDVPVYHWDNDHYEQETKTLQFDSIQKAFEAQRYLLNLPYEQEWSFSDKKSYGFVSRELEPKDYVLVELDVWHGGVFECGFSVYTEATHKTIYTQDETHLHSTLEIK